MSILLTSCLQGLAKFEASGMPANVELRAVSDALAVDPANVQAGELDASSVFADLHEISWSGTTPYAPIVVAVPSPSSGVYTFTGPYAWGTGTATNGPSTVPTIALVVQTSHELLSLWDAAYFLNGGNPINLAGTFRTLRIDAFTFIGQIIEVTT